MSLPSVASLDMNTILVSFKTIVEGCAIAKNVAKVVGPGQQLARAINEHARALRGHGIEVVIHWVPGHSGISGNEQADRQANKARECRGYTVRERIYTSAANRARRISEGRSAAKAKWEADKCSKHFGYRLKGKAGSKRPVPMTSVKPLATRFYRLKSGHAPTGVYLKRFGHRERRQVLVVRRDDSPDAGAPLSPLQPVERPAERALESGGEGNRLESGQIPARAGF
ncbi:hypothetical protein BDD12DRAFT_893114 [Trichophaea hybrida]|nr:hypothetical protein BDD12DRAFT_893114 [Trichophaea hybrida]